MPELKVSKVPRYKSLAGVEGWRLATFEIKRLIRKRGGFPTCATLYWLSSLDFHCAVSVEGKTRTTQITPDNLYTALALIRLKSMLDGHRSIDGISDPWCSKFPVFFPENTITTSSDGENFLLSYTPGLLLINGEESSVSSYTITVTVAS